MLESVAQAARVSEVFSIPLYFDGWSMKASYADSDVDDYSYLRANSFGYKLRQRNYDMANMWWELERNLQTQHERTYRWMSSSAIC